MPFSGRHRTPQCVASLQAGAARLAYEAARVVVDGCGLQQHVAALEICTPCGAELHAKRGAACLGMLARASNKGLQPDRTCSQAE